jgi:Uma2 family endonuclease
LAQKNWKAAPATSKTLLPARSKHYRQTNCLTNRLIKSIFEKSRNMSALPATKLYTPEEYLLLEETAVEKHEYYQGEIFAMSGGSLVHNQIVRNALTAIDSALRKSQCQVFPSDLKVQIEANTLFTYPDLSIVCGPVELWNNRNDAITNPSVIIEVLSPSTSGYDHGEKFKLYRDIPSLKEYILIASTEIMVERYLKQSDHFWNYFETKNLENDFVVETIGFSCPLSEIYRDVSFD